VQGIIQTLEDTHCIQENTHPLNGSKSVNQKIQGLWGFKSQRFL